MAPRFTEEQARKVVDAVQECLDEGFKLKGSPNAIYEAGRRNRLNQSTVRDRLQRAEMYFDLRPVQREDTLDDAQFETERPKIDGLDQLVKKMLIKGPTSLAEMSTKTKADTGQLLDAIEELQRQGANVHRTGDRYDIPRFAEQSWLKGASLEFESDENHFFTFGVVGGGCIVVADGNEVQTASGCSLHGEEEGARDRLSGLARAASIAVRSMHVQIAAIPARSVEQGLLGE